VALMEMKDGKPVPTFKVHFGYTDGISVTSIRGGVCIFTASLE
jgi:hypothetical protein